MTQIFINRGDIFWVNFDPSVGTETQKTRPALILSNDILNHNSKKVIVAPITSNLKKIYSFEFHILKNKFVKGKVMLDQIRTIDKCRLSDKISCLSLTEMREIQEILKSILSL